MLPQRRRESRGPYKKYLYDLSIPVPRTSAWRLSKVKNGEHDEIVENANCNDNDIQSEEEHINRDSDYELSSIEINVKSSDDCESLSNRESNTNHTPVSIQSSPVSFLSDDENNSFNLSDNYLLNDRNLGSDEEEVNYFNDESCENIPYRNENNEDERGKPLYEGCRLTANESAILIMSFIIRWGLEDKSIDQLLQLIDCHLPSSVLESRYLFLKKFPVPNQIIIHYTCPDCSELLPMDFEQLECKRCNQNLNRNKLKENGNYFVQLSIDVLSSLEQELQELYSHSKSIGAAGTALRSSVKLYHMFMEYNAPLRIDSSNAEE
ncbi:uncharacterized protein [Temnothorax nylanderi]|uniref:uncharacterized protein n=1 Tax=Temnothorax nylanderi TaxID=102681 RepID=UPI003A86AC95